jgi:hypothetical protein
MIPSISNGILDTPDSAKRPAEADETDAYRAQRLVDFVLATSTSHKTKETDRAIQEKRWRGDFAASRELLE